MKIAIAATRYPPATGGAEAYIERVALGLSDRGHRVKVLTTDYEQHLRYRRFPSSIPWREYRGGVIVARDRSIALRRYGYFITPGIPARTLLDPPDVVYAIGFARWPALAAAVAGRIARKKVVLQPNFAVPDTPFQKVYQRLVAPILRRADAAVFYSEFERELMESYGSIPVRSIVAPPGINPMFLEESPTRGVLERFGLGSRPVVLSVGRVDEGKSLDILVEAAPIILKAVPKAAFLVAGPDFGETAKLKSLADECGVSDRVVFSGPLSDGDLVSAYREAKAFAHPSGFELFGIVLAEAFASGLPVVAARAGSVPEVVDNEQTGLLVTPDDPEALAEALVRVLTDESLGKTLTAAAKRKATEKYNWGATVDRIERLLIEVTES